MPAHKPFRDGRQHRAPASLADLTQGLQAYNQAMAAEVVIRLRVEPVEDGGFVATSPDVPGLVAEGRSVVEAAEIAQGLARRIYESCLEHGDPVPPALQPLSGNPREVELTVPVGVR